MSSAPDPSTSVLMELEREWARAIVANDVRRIAVFVTDDWVLVTGSGVTPRERFLSNIEAGLLEHVAMSPHPPSRVRVHGDTAVVVGRVTSTARWQGQQFDADEWQTDVFVRAGDSWLCTLTHLTTAEPGR